MKGEVVSRELSKRFARELAVVRITRCKRERNAAFEHEKFAVD